MEIPWHLLDIGVAKMTTITNAGNVYRPEALRKVILFTGRNSNGKSLPGLLLVGKRRAYAYNELGLMYTTAPYVPDASVARGRGYKVQNACSNLLGHDYDEKKHLHLQPFARVLPLWQNSMTKWQTLDLL